MLLRYYLKSFIALQILTHKIVFQLLHMLKNMLIKYVVMNHDIVTQLLDNLYIEVLEVDVFKHIKRNSAQMVYRILILIVLIN